MKNFINGKVNLLLSFIFIFTTSCRIIQNRNSKKDIIVTAEHHKRIEYFTDQHPAQLIIAEKKAADQNSNVFDIFHTKEYKVYNGLKDQAAVLDAWARDKFILSDELKIKALESSYASQTLVDSSERVQNKTIAAQLLKHAELLDKEFISLMTQSDSIRELARNSDAAWYSRRIEAEMYVQSVDPKRYNQIMALYNILDMEKIRTMAMNDGQ